MENNEEKKHPLDGKLERIATALEGILYHLAGTTKRGGAGGASSGNDADRGAVKMTVRVVGKVADWKNGGGAFYKGEREGDGAEIRFGAKDEHSILDGDIFEGIFSQKGDGEKATYFLSKVLKLVSSTGDAKSDGGNGKASSAGAVDDEEIPF